MDNVISFFSGFVMALLIWSFSASAPINYKMINKAEQICYSNHSVDEIRVENSDTISITCRNGAKFKFEREGYIND